MHCNNTHEIDLLKNLHSHPPYTRGRWLKVSAVALMISSIMVSTISFAEDSSRSDLRPEAPHGQHPRCNASYDGGMPRSPGMILRGLNLSDEQEAKVFKLTHASQPLLHANDQVIRQSQKALMDLTHARSFDAATAESLSQTMAQAMASSLLIRAQTDQQIYQLLTNEQKKALADRRNKFESRIGN